MRDIKKLFGEKEREDNVCVRVCVSERDVSQPHPLPNYKRQRQQRSCIGFLPRLNKAQSSYLNT